MDHPAQLDRGTAGLHAGLLTLDSHIDIPWPNGDDPHGRTSRRVDFPKMRRGGLRAGCFAAYIPQGPRTPEGVAAARRRTLDMLDTIRATGTSQGGIDARVCASADSIEAAWRDDALAVIPAVENAYGIGEELTMLPTLRALGVVYVTLTHNGHNAWADSSNPRADLADPPALHGGLSVLGRSAVAAMNRAGLLVDVSHVSRDAMVQAVSASRTPVVATHSCMRALCDVPRNLDDAQLDLLRDSGGLVQVTAVPSFLRPRGRPDQVGVSDFADHVDHAVSRCGLAHVGISSDFDGGGGLRDWHDAGQSPNLTAELARRGYDAAALAALWGGNFLRLLRQAEAAVG